MSTGHDHALPTGGNERMLRYALMLTGSFLLAEVIGGVMLNSLALLSDAAHMFTDVAALAIALAAIRVARRPADDRRTFGYHRFETGKDASLNVKGAYLEVWSDLLGSIGVIAGALVIRVTGWNWVDTVVAVAIGLWVLPRTWILLKETLNILLEGVPEGIDLPALRQSLLDLPGVLALHDLHVWALTSGKPSLTVHLVHDAQAGPSAALLVAARELLAAKYGIPHITVQLETEACAQAAQHDEDAGHRHARA